MKSKPMRRENLSEMTADTGHRWPAYRDRGREDHILPCPLPELADIIEEKSGALVSAVCEKASGVSKRPSGGMSGPKTGGLEPSKSCSVSSYFSALSGSLRTGDVQPFLEYQLEEARRCAREGVPLEEFESRISAVRETLREALLKSAKSPDQVLAFTLCFRVIETLIDASSALVARHYILSREEELRAKERQLEMLSRRLLTIQEEERKRLATDIHDELIQLLFGLRFELDVVRGRLGDGLPVERELVTMKSRVDQGLTELRRILRNLRPALLDDLGLVSALRLLVRQVNENSGLTATLESGDGADRLPPEVETCLYRVAQEALNNAVKHSGGREVRSRLDVEGGTAVLSVADDGIGFDASGLQGGDLLAGGERFGLYGMRERVRGLDGTLTVESRPGAGTRVTAALALSGKAAPNGRERGSAKGEERGGR